jgi:hypothetical protein
MSRSGQWFPVGDPIAENRRPLYTRTPARGQMAAAFAKAGREGIRRMAKVVSKARPAPRPIFRREARSARLHLPRRLLRAHALPGDSGADRSAARGQNGARSGRLVMDQMVSHGTAGASGHRSICGPTADLERTRPADHPRYRGCVGRSSALAHRPANRRATWLQEVTRPHLAFSAVETTGPRK